MPISEETINNVLVVWELEGNERAPLAFFNQGVDEATVKAWRVDGNLHLLTAWAVIPSNLFWVVKEHIEPLPFGRYRVDVKPSEVLWWADSEVGRSLDGSRASRRLRPQKALKTARIVIG